MCISVQVFIYVCMINQISYKYDFTLYWFFCVAVIGILNPGTLWNCFLCLYISSVGWVRGGCGYWNQSRKSCRRWSNCRPIKNGRLLTVYWMNCTEQRPLKRRLRRLRVHRIQVDNRIMQLVGAVSSVIRFCLIWFSRTAPKIAGENLYGHQFSLFPLHSPKEGAARQSSLTNRISG